MAPTPTRTTACRSPMLRPRPVVAGPRPSLSPWRRGNGRPRRGRKGSENARRRTADGWGRAIHDRDPWQRHWEKRWMLEVFGWEETKYPQKFHTASQHSYIVCSCHEWYFCCFIWGCHIPIAHHPSPSLIMISRFLVVTSSYYIYIYMILEHLKSPFCLGWLPCFPGEMTRFRLLLKPNHHFLQCMALCLAHLPGQLLSALDDLDQHISQAKMDGLCNPFIIVPQWFPGGGWY